MAEDQLTKLTPELAEQLAQNWRRVSALYMEILPVFRGEVSLSNWRPAAMACLARGHYVQQSLFMLGERKMDAAVLARVAFEHLVTFAWVMVDPDAHHPRFLRTEHGHLVELLKDVGAQVSNFAIEGSAASLSDLESHAAPVGRGMPGFGTRAAEADAYWKGVLPEHAWQFRLLYATLYRPYSAYVHPLLSGLWPFIHSGADVRIGGEPRDLVPGHIFAHSTALLSSALVIASQRLGWPKYETVRTAWTHGIEAANGEIRLKDSRDG